ncbi:MAG: LptF/LptG family permease, partial [Candidatus Omnitrophota bacterium]|nr:LptF/LptG family permease [Candidatus Omnitrophota bacterium]
YTVSMRILDRYVVKQLLPVGVWCLIVFLLLTCLIDLFGRLDEILRYHIPARTVLDYYANFLPTVFIKACPLALLLGCAFVAMRLARHQELLAMNASGTSLLRASVPFLFVGWLASVCVFTVNEQIVPRATMTYERIRDEAFRGRSTSVIENVAIMDSANRLYHAQTVDLKAKELHHLTVLEQNWQNQPTRSLYASRAVWTRHGWLLLGGTIYHVGPRGAPVGTPELFVERLKAFPVTPMSFAEPESRPETMRYGQLRLLISSLKQTGMTNVRRYTVELAAKLTLPFMNLVMCLIGFVGSTQPQLRGNLRGLGMSLGWGMAYYLIVAVGQAIARQWPLPAVIGVWAPHLAAIWWCVRRLRA